MLRRSNRHRSLKPAFCEPLEARRMLYVHYSGSPSWGFSNITYSYTNALDGGLAGVTPLEVSNAVNEAFALWAGVIPRTFTRVADPNPNFTTDETYDASGWPIIRIGQHNIDGIDGTLAHAWRPGSNGQNGELHFDISEAWAYGKGTGGLVRDIVETALHEIGHTLGLDHQPAPPGGIDAIMNPSYVGRFTGPGTGFLLQDDINGIQALYGAGLGYALDIDGTMYVAGTSGNNTITVSKSGGNFTVDSAGSGSFTRSTSGVNRLVIRGGPGSDLFIVNDMPFPVDVYGGDVEGTTDTLRMIAPDTTNSFTITGNNISGHSASGNTGIENYELFGGSLNDTFHINGAPTKPILINGKFGHDTFNVNAMSNSLTLEGDFGNDTFNINCTGSTTAAIMRGGFEQDTFNYQEINIATTANGGDGNDTFNLAVNGGFEKIRAAVTLNGDAGDDVANLATNAPGSVRVIISPVTFNGGINQDTLNVGGGWLDAVQSLTTFSGGNDGLDKAVLNDSAVSAPYSYSATSTMLTRDAFFGGLTFFGTYKVVVECTQGNNTVTIANGIATSIDVRGNNGDDSFVTGGGQLQGSAGHPLNGGSGIDNITFDDRLDTTNRTWQLFPDLVNFAGTFISTVGFESVSVLAGTGSDAIVFVTATYDQNMTADGGGGLDQFTVPGVEMTSLTLRGGNDAVLDFLDIDDRNFPGNVVGGTIYADRIERDVPGQTANVYYSGFANVNWYLQNQQNAVVVRGTPADIGSNYQFSVIGNASDDYLQVQTQDAAGNPTILGNLRFDGGGGPDLIQTFAGPTPANYRFYDPFGGNTAYLANNGPGWIAIASDVETLQVYGGAQNDTFVVEKYAQGGSFTLFGGDGDDTCTIGNGDMSLNLTNSVYFEFNGQNGSDRFTVANGVTNVSWNYNVISGSLTAVKPSTGYSWNSRTTSIESQYVFAGPLGDTFNIDATASGLYTEFNGFGGYDALRAGTANLAVNNIRGPISFNAGADGGSVLVSNVGGFPATVHQTATTIGAYAGDSLFGAGGSLTFSGVTNNPIGGGAGIGISLASNSTIYAQPLAGTLVNVTSGFLFEGPSGSIKLATAGVTNPVINGNSASGSLTSSNRQTLSWSNFAGAIQTDAIAPAFVAGNINLDGVPGFDGADALAGNQLSLDVQFSENVSGLLSPASLVLTNLTTSQVIPTANIAVSYNAGTNTARFTFPGYPNGALPDGNYQAKILAGLPDFFGNPLAADAMFNFFFLVGDANHDAVVDTIDFNTLAANFSQSGTFSTGDFNYDGVIDTIDFNLLAGNFSKALSAPAAAGGSERLFSAWRVSDDRLAVLN